MRIKHWTQIAGGGRNGFIDNRPYIETVSALEKYVTLDDSERSVISEAADRFPMRITPYYLSLIDPNDPNDPIRRMCIPSAAELDASGSYDTSGENDNTVRDGIQHIFRLDAFCYFKQFSALYYFLFYEQEKVKCDWLNSSEHGVFINLFIFFRHIWKYGHRSP